MNDTTRTCSYAPLPMALLARRDLSSAAKLVAAAIVSHTLNESGGWTWPSIRRLADLTALGRRRVQQGVGELIAAGVLEVDRRPGRATRYRLVSTPEPAPNTGAKSAAPASAKAESQPEKGRSICAPTVNRGALSAPHLRSICAPPAQNLRPTRAVSAPHPRTICAPPAHYTRPTRALSARGSALSAPERTNEKRKGKELELELECAANESSNGDSALAAALPPPGQHVAPGLLTQAIRRALQLGSGDPRQLAADRATFGRLAAHVNAGHLGDPRDAVRALLHTAMDICEERADRGYGNVAGVYMERVKRLLRRRGYDWQDVPEYRDLIAAKGAGQ